ncbi:MAG: hypothetical protein ACK501_13210 [Planctomycetota bacterium]|jgi:hypothetical protein
MESLEVHIPGDVASFAADPARRELVFGCLASLDFCGLLREVRARVEVARGSLVQFESVFPERTKAAARFGLRVFGALEQVVSLAGMWLAMREAGAEDVAQVEAGLVQGVSALMDLWRESFTAFGEDARIAVAGLGGLGAYRSNGVTVTSVFGEVLQLVGDVRLAVVGVGNPFERFLPDARDVERGMDEPRRKAVRRRSVGKAVAMSESRPTGATQVYLVRGDGSEKRAPKLQAGREKPSRPQDTDERDLAILRAIRAGHVGKNTAAATAKFGRPSGKSHVEKRRQDFVRWGWLWPGRDAELTEDGRRWLAELAPSGRAPANFAAPAT